VKSLTTTRNIRRHHAEKKRTYQKRVVDPTTDAGADHDHSPCSQDFRPEAHREVRRRLMLGPAMIVRLVRKTSVQKLIANFASD
jgi:hypothetical protein